jgi:glyceraldehyde-3-phosphate dehydrogenase (NAD(P))
VSHLAIGVAGYDRLGRRAADAVAQQPDLRLRGVYEPDDRRSRLAAEAGHSPTRGAFVDWANDCDVIINNLDTLPDVNRPVVHGPRLRQEAPLFSALVSERDLRCWNGVKVPCADALAFARLIRALQSLGPITRLYATIIRPCSVCGDEPSTSDSLRPVPNEPAEDEEIQNLLASRIRDYHVRRVEAPHTQSHLSFIKLDFADMLIHDDALRALQRAARITVAQAADGFPDTAHVQEFYRDLGRPRADRPELFIWEESVMVDRDSLYFFVDVAHEATPLLEVIDAARLLGRRGLSLAESMKRTDQALGIL